MDDLEPVVLRKPRLSPIRPRSDLTVVLDGYPVPFQPQILDEIFEAGLRGKILKDARLAIEDQAERHVFRLTAPCGHAAWKARPVEEAYSSKISLRSRCKIRIASRSAVVAAASV